MPVFELQHPDGKTYEVDAPDMQAASAGMAEHRTSSATGMDTAEDVVKSGAVGVGKGIIGLAGLPGDAAGLLNRGIDYGMDKVGLGPQQKTDYDLGGSGQIQRGVERATGEFYKPKTTAGEYAQTIGEFVPAAAAGPGSLVRKAALQVALPAVASETAGQMTKGTAVEPYARAGAGIAGGVVGGVLSTAGGADRALRRQLPAFVTDAHIGQAEALIGDAAQRGVRLTWPEALSQVTGRPVLTDVQRIAESHPRTRGTMNEVMGERPATMDRAAHDEIDQLAPANAAPSTIGPAAGREAEGVVNDVRDVINTHTEPFYRASEAIRLTPAQMGQVRRTTPGFADARDAIRNDPQLNRYVDHLPDNSVGFLNEVKKYLEQQGQNARAPMAQNPNMQRAAGFGTDAATVRRAAIDAAGRATAPGANPYEVALNVQAQTRQQFLEPLLQGPLGKLADRDIATKKAIEALFPSQPLANSQDEIGTAVRALANRNPVVARQLVRAHVEAELDKAFNSAGRGQEAAQFSGATFAKNIVGSPTVPTQRMQNLRAAIEALPNGPATWDGFARFLEIAQATGTRQPIGSRTAFNAQELQGMTAGSMIEGAAKTGLSPGKWVSIVYDKWGEWQAGRHLDELARIVTDPQSAAYLRRINRMPARSREAGLTAARIIGQASSTNQGGPLRVTVTPADRQSEQPSQR